MNVLGVHDPPAPALARALADFERQFQYPLGPGRFFRIEHGDDYACFYRAQGPANCFVCEQEGRVLGVLAVALRPLLSPEGCEHTTAYIGDLKVAPEARVGTTLIRLVRVAWEWLGKHTDRAFGVVMDGTATVPASYTGRAGIPSFTAVADVMVLRLTGPETQSIDTHTRDLDELTAKDWFCHLSRGRHACPVGMPATRSLLVPRWLGQTDGMACGCLEDTRRGKRLMADDGQEMISAHLSNFAYRDLRAGAALLRSALAHTSESGYPALFVAVAREDAAGLCELLNDVERVQAPATIFGHGFPAGHAWNINSAEI